MFLIVTLKALFCLAILNAQRLPAVGRAYRCVKLNFRLMQVVPLASTDGLWSQGGLNPGGALRMARPRLRTLDIHADLVMKATGG